MKSSQSILISSHPRSGTHLLIDVIRRNFPQTRSWRWWGQPLDYLYLNVERSTSKNRHFDHRFRNKIINRIEIPILKTHYLADFSSTWTQNETGEVPPDVLELIDSSVSIYIHRDPRDVMTSYKQFLSSLSREVYEMSLMEFMNANHWKGGTHLQWWKRHVEGWMQRPNCQVLSFRELLESPEKVLAKISDAVKIPPAQKTPILPKQVTSITKTRLDRLLSLSPSSTAIIADRKRFPSQDWREELSSSDHKSLEREVGPTMDELGYERCA